MNNDYQFIGTQLVVKLFYLIVLLLFAYAFRIQSKKLFYFSIITATTVFINLLISIPLPIQIDNTSFAYMTTHVLSVLIINYLKFVVLFYMPYEKAYWFLNVLKKPTVKYTVIGVFGFLISGVLLVNSFGNFLEKYDIFLLFTSIDAITTTIVAGVYSYFFFQSFVSISKIKVFNTLLAFILIASNAFFLIYFLKTFDFIVLPDSVWFRIISFSISIISLFFNAYYIASYVVYSAANQRSMAIEENGWDEIVTIQAIHVAVISSKVALALTLVNKEGVKEKMNLEISKATKPFAYWVQFAIAKKLNIHLTHADISIIKFRMVEFWNKSMQAKIRQDLLFSNSRIQYDFQVDPSQVTIEFDATILQKNAIYQNTFIEFYRDFQPVLQTLNVKIEHKKDEKSIANSFLAVLNLIK